MVEKIDKVIATNLGALTTKYGPKGAAAIRKAIGKLIAADKQRGLSTKLIAIDSAAEMKALPAPRVKQADSRPENKAAIDAVYRALAPDYLMLLGAIDVIPHQDPRNPMRSGRDVDESAFGDLPYACEAAYSQEPGDFLGPTRVVGRLPDVTGGTDAAYLVSLIEVAAGYKQIAHEKFTEYLAVTAEVWAASTKLSVTTTFGGSTSLQDVPPSDPNWATNALQRPVHFFNCHGVIGDARFFGQPASGAQDFPTAHDASYVDGKLPEGVIVAAECCYGGELYALSPTQAQIGMCNTYLKNKSYGFLGSTTIAYGPSAGNGQADLICQYFLQNLLEGASLGRAVLEARQKFVRVASPPNPADLKTLMQFNLYGDPSITPVHVPQAVVTAATTTSISTKSVRPPGDAARSERQDRRRALFKEGLNLANTEAVARRTKAEPPKSILDALRAKAGELGMEPGETLSFNIRHPATPKSMPRMLSLAPQANRATAFHVMFAEPISAPKPKAAIGALTSVKAMGAAEAVPAAPPNVTLIRALIGKEVDGKLVSVNEILSR